MEGKGKTSVLYVVFNIIDIIHLENTGEISPKAPEKRVVLIGKQLLPATHIKLCFGKHDRIETNDRIALPLVILGKLFHILFYNFGVIVSFLCDADDSSACFLVYFSVFGKLLQIFAVRNIVQIAELFPLRIFVNFSVVIASFRKGAVSGKYNLSAHQRVYKDHNDRHNYYNGNKSVQQPFEQILCHNYIPRYILR